MVAAPTEPSSAEPTSPPGPRAPTLDLERLAMPHPIDRLAARRALPPRMRRAVAAALAARRLLGDAAARPDEPLETPAATTVLDAARAGGAGAGALVEGLRSAAAAERLGEAPHAWRDLVAQEARWAAPTARLVADALAPDRPERLAAVLGEVEVALAIATHLHRLSIDLGPKGSGRCRLPIEAIAPFPDFVARARASRAAGHATDPEILEASRRAVRAGAELAWGILEAAESALPDLPPEALPWTRLRIAQARLLVDRLVLWNCETLLHAPVVGAVSRLLAALRVLLARRTH